MGDAPGQMLLAYNWPAIERHPRIPWDGEDELVREMILRYLDEARPFTVVR